MKLLLVVMQPPAPLMQALLEHTCELAPALPHVQGARLVQRRLTPAGRIVTVQRWRARAAVPALLQPHLEPGLQDWTLTFEHAPGAPGATGEIGSIGAAADTTVHWHAESAAVQVPGRCHGTLGFAPAAGGRGTRIAVSAEFATTGEGLRTLFGTLLARHWRALAEAAAARVAATTPAD